MQGMRVAVVQLTSTVDSAANRARIDESLAGVGPEVDLVLLPEAVMHDFGDADHDLAAAAEPLDGPFVEHLGTHARRLGAVVIAGMFEASGHLPFNTLVAVRPDGRLAAAYRKIHLYDSFGYRESDRLSPGEIHPTVVDVAGVGVGLMTCYDLRFPEMGRALVDAGADVFAVPAAWVRGADKLEHWRTLVAARAIENTVAVAAAAQSGERYVGHSLVVDAAGRIVEEAGDGDDLLLADLDAEAIAQVRRINPSLLNRRMAKS
jgi:predicted amidohydrolase